MTELPEGFTAIRPSTPWGGRPPLLVIQTSTSYLSASLRRDLDYPSHVTIGKNGTTICLCPDEHGDGFKIADNGRIGGVALIVHLGLPRGKHIAEVRDGIAYVDIPHGDGT